MNYKVLYRKYRPDSFENIVGQDYIIKTLKNSLINNTVSHAYIFSGPRGTGKTSTAKVFAKALNCLNLKDGSPCNNCEFCSNFQENPDIIEIDAASNNGVDEIRTLIDNIKLTPTNGKYKVYIIDEVHMLSTSAFNALLLTLEEPPHHAIFILATTNIESVPITILSRCQRFDFQKIKVECIVKRLKEICEIENIQIEADALNEIAYLSEGGMRDALSLLDQLSKNNSLITLELIENQIKTISKKSILDLINAIEDNSSQKLIELIDDFRVRATDYKTLIKKIIDISTAKIRDIKLSGKQKRLTFNDYKEIINRLSEAIVKININVDPFTIIEIILLDYVDPIDGKVSNKTDISFDPEKSEEKIINLKVNEKTDSNQEEIKKEVDDDFIKLRINNCFANAQKSYLEEMKTKLNNLLEETSGNGKIRSILVDSALVAASDKNLIFACEFEYSADDANNNLEEVENFINSSFQSNYKIIFLSNRTWDNEKKEYVNNLKNNKKYTYQEELDTDDKKSDDILDDIFDISKIEII